MSALPPARPVYLTTHGEDPFFCLLHMTADGTPATHAVLMCPPFGWEDICSHRSRRDWAELLARAGYPTLRFDLPSSGDSAGTPDDPRRLAAWVGAVGSAAEWLRVTTGARRVTAIGIGLGGMLACRAVAEGACIDELVLWAVQSRGQAFLRELRAFERMNGFRSARGREPGPSALDAGSLAVGGFLLSAETIQALEGLDVATLAIPEGQVARALLLERDGIAIDGHLRDHLQASGTAVTVAPGRGYSDMMAPPHDARSPRATFAEVQEWLAETSPLRAGASPRAAPLASPARASRWIKDPAAVELSVDGTRVSETPLAIEQPFGQVFGVLAEPVDVPELKLTAVLLNAGATRHIGPNRMWVEIARRWAARGVPTLRVDLEGIGDADGNVDRFDELAEFYVPEFVDQAIAVVDALDARRLGPTYVLGGLCSGASWSFHAAVRDRRVAAAFMINPRILFWDPAHNTARDVRRGLLRPSSWSKVLRGDVPPSRVIALAYQAPYRLPRLALERWHARRGGPDEVERALDRLRETGKHVQFIFSGNEPLSEELAEAGRLQPLDRWPNVGFDLIPGEDHSLRPLESQRGAHDALDRALEEALRRVAAEPAGIYPASVAVTAFNSCG